MSAQGSWKVTMTTPVGPQDMVLHIDTLGEGFTGRIESPMGNHAISGTAAKGTLSWQMKAAKPMPITVTFLAEFAQDTMRGTARLGIFGKSQLSGERLSAEAATQSARADEAVVVTGDSVDPCYAEPYVDIEEQREQPVPHRYVHGGFRGTDARFSFYFPAREKYQGRFFHNTYPLALSEDIGPFPIAFDISTGDLGFTFDSGAYYVQTNLGGADRAGGMADPAIAAYRVNAAAAKYSRVVAARLYGPHRSYGYLFGGSGGSYQTIGAAENTRGVWDGFVPFVMATPNAIPSMFTVRMHALRVLRQRNRWPAVMDAIEPGGSGDPYATLNDEEAAALREATRMGYPPRGWWNHATLDSGYFAQVAPLMPMLDPGYVEDFWSKPGYLGSDPHAEIWAERFAFETVVESVIEGFPRQLVLSQLPARDIADAHLVLLSGASAGSSVPIATVDGRRVGFAYAADQTVASGIRAGDRVRIDNVWGLALQTYHRHQVPTPDLYGWNQFRAADGLPAYPQREVLIGPIAAAGTAGGIPSGAYGGRMLVVQCLMDIDALAWQADWYRGQVRAALGDEFDDRYALYYIDHAQHDNPQSAAAQARTVNFSGALQQALRDVSAWVEQGRRPWSTCYEIVDSQVVVPAAAAARGGIQPIVTLQVEGGPRADAAVGETLRFSARIDVPPGAGSVVGAEWDFEGSGSAPLRAEIAAGQASVRLESTHAYARPGTYFAVLRAAAHRDGDRQTPYARVQNLARVRVVVQ